MFISIQKSDKKDRKEKTQIWSASHELNRYRGSNVI